MKGNRKVLLVDDDELVQSSVKAMLEMLGDTVTIAPSGEAALLELEGGIEPDVVILDVNMPGLGGVGTLPRLRALRPDLPVLLSTGRPSLTTDDLVKAHPLVALLSKPYTLAELHSHLGELLREA